MSDTTKLSTGYVIAVLGALLLIISGGLFLGLAFIGRNGDSGQPNGTKKAPLIKTASISFSTTPEVAATSAGETGIFLTGGLGITYQDGDKRGFVSYPVDGRLIGYCTYEDFKSEWSDNVSATVELALSTKDQVEWQLFYADVGPTTDTEVTLSQVTPTDWRTYLVFAQADLTDLEGAEVAGEFSLPKAELVVDLGPNQKITNSISMFR